MIYQIHKLRTLSLVYVLGNIPRLNTPYFLTFRVVTGSKPILLTSKGVRDRVEIRNRVCRGDMISKEVSLKDKEENTIWVTGEGDILSDTI